MLFSQTRFLLCCFPGGGGFAIQLGSTASLNGGWGIVGGSGSWADGLGVEGDELETVDMEGGEMEGVGNCRPMAVGRQKAMDKALQG